MRGLSICRSIKRLSCLAPWLQSSTLLAIATLCSLSFKRPCVCRQWIRKEVAVTDLEKNFDLSGLAKRLLHKDELPEFQAKQLSYDDLIEQGDRIVQEVRDLVLMHGLRMHS